MWLHVVGVITDTKLQSNGSAPRPDHRFHAKTVTGLKIDTENRYGTNCDAKSIKIKGYIINI